MASKSMTSKDRILEVISQLPDDVSIDQAIDRLYLLEKVEQGLRQADEGDVISHEQFEGQILGDQP
jgi:predicted transcriptional regulator